MVMEVLSKLINYQYTIIALREKLDAKRKVTVHPNGNITK